MAARITDAEVRAIIVTDETISDLTPFITMANELVNEYCLDAGYSDTRLELIERLLAAHFYCLKDTRVKMEKAGSVSQTYDTYLQIGFNHTHHGQMALRMDTAGGLVALEKQSQEGGEPVIGVSYIGTEEE